MTAQHTKDQLIADLQRLHKIDIERIDQLKDGCVKLNFKIDSLTEQRDELDSKLSDKIQLAQALNARLEGHRIENDLLKQQRDELLAALKKHGKHEHSCRWWIHENYVCNCGLHEAITKAGGEL